MPEEQPKEAAADVKKTVDVAPKMSAGDVRGADDAAEDAAVRVSAPSVEEKPVNTMAPQPAKPVKSAKTQAASPRCTCPVEDEERCHRGVTCSECGEGPIQGDP